MLAEFKYAGVPKETSGSTIPGFDQATPRTSFYYLKKDFFPWVYYNYMVKGQWVDLRDGFDRNGKVAFLGEPALYKRSVFRLLSSAFSL